MRSSFSTSPTAGLQPKPPVHRAWRGSPKSRITPHGRRRCDFNIQPNHVFFGAIDVLQPQLAIDIPHDPPKNLSDF